MLEKSQKLSSEEIRSIDTGYNVSSAVNECLFSITKDDKHHVDDDVAPHCTYGFLVATLVQIREFIDFCGEDVFQKFCEEQVVKREKEKDGPHKPPRSPADNQVG